RRCLAAVIDGDLRLRVLELHGTGTAEHGPCDRDRWRRRECKLRWCAGCRSVRIAASPPASLRGGGSRSCRISGSLRSTAAGPATATTPFGDVDFGALVGSPQGEGERRASRRREFLRDAARCAGEERTVGAELQLGRSVLVGRVLERLNHIVS